MLQSVLRKRSSRGQPSEHEADHGEAYPGFAAGDRGLVVSDKPPAYDPGQGALDDPSLGQHHERILALQLGHDHEPEAEFVGRPVLERTPVGTVGEDHLEPRVGLPPELRERGPGSDRIGDARLVHMERMQEPERVDDDVALAAYDTLAAVVATASPFSVVLTETGATAPRHPDCVSMMTALGVASRPSFWRTSVRSAS